MVLYTQAIAPGDKEVDLWALILGVREATVGRH